MVFWGSMHLTTILSLCMAPRFGEESVVMYHETDESEIHHVLDQLLCMFKYLCTCDCIVVFGDISFLYSDKSSEPRMTYALLILLFHY